MNKKDNNDSIMTSPIDDDVNSIFNEFMVKFACDYGHTTIGTQHLYLGVMAFLNKHSGSGDKYSDLFGKMQAILSKYGMSDLAFATAMFSIYPKCHIIDPSTDPEMSSDNDIQTIVSKLQRQAIKESRTLGVPNLMIQLFADSDKAPFNLRKIFIKAFTDTKRPEKVQSMYDEFIEMFKPDAETKSSNQGIADICEKTDFLTDINALVADCPHSIVGGDDLIKSISVGLIGKNKRSVVLTGMAGVGKTEAVYDLAQRINAGKAPSAINVKHIYRLNLDKISAGGTYPGMIEGRLGVVLDAAAADHNSILFVDEAQYLFTIAEMGSPIISIIKPYLSDGSVSMIMTITDSDFHKYFSKDSGFSRRLREIHVKEPSDEDTKTILLGIRGDKDKFYGMTLSDDIVSEIATLSKKYSLNKANPDKSIDMMDLAYSYAKVTHPADKNVTKDDLVDAITQQYGIHVSKDNATETEKALHEKLLGQDEAINQIAWSLRTIDLGLYNPEKPMLSMLFAGPTGVGKTESARIIAKNYFGKSDALIKLSMGEYADEISYNKLIGSAPGYVGYDDDTGLLASIKRNPCSLVLFDEIEKAHPKVLKTLLSMLDDGIVNDSHGDEVSFRNAIIVFTTNLGYDSESTNTSGMGEIKVMDDKHDAEMAITKYFPPEFKARINKVVIFNRLDDRVFDSLIKRYHDMYETLSGGKVKVAFTKEDIDAIKVAADIENKGARGLDEAVRSQIQTAYERQISETAKLFAASKLATASKATAKKGK